MQQKIIRHIDHADRGIVTRKFMLDVIWSSRFPNRICRDKPEFLKRQKMLPFWNNLQRVDVLDAARKIPGEFSTHDIADAMCVDEYPVRAAMVWLVRKGVVEICGQRDSFTKRSHDRYHVTIYRVKPEATEVDFATLMRALCRS